MMRKGLMLLVMSLAGVASAISVSWNGNTAAGVGTSTLSTTTAINTNPTTVSIVISGMNYTSWVAAQTGARLFTVYGSNGTAGANDITTGGTGEGSGATSKSYFDFYVADNGELGWGVAGNKGLNGYVGNTTGWKITDLFNGTDSLTLTFTKSADTQAGMQLSDSSGNSVQLGTAGGSYGFASGYVWNTITVTSLPEPGVLALLALGAAGLALRRKAA